MVPDISSDYWQKLNSLNEWVHPGVLRRFQLTTALDGHLTIRRGRQNSRSAGSAVLPNLHVAYWFPEGPRPMWIATDLLAEGSPLCWQWEVSDRSLRPVHESHRLAASNTAQILSWLEQLESQVRECRPRTPEPASSEARLIVGDPNFAHQLWNEAPAALELGRVLPVDQRLKISVIRLPLAALHGAYSSNQLIPSPRPKTLTYEPNISWVRPGSTRVTDSVRELVVGSLASLEPDERAVLDQAGPKIWISLRRDRRACENLFDFLGEVVTQTVAAYPRALFLIDGFTPPDDWPANPQYAAQAAAFTARKELALEDFNEFVDHVSSRVSRAAFVRIGGRTLGRAISWAKHADYYITHTGTYQHKLGWIHRTPGFIHYPPDPRSHDVARWHGAQVDNGVAPLGLEPGDVRAVGSGFDGPERNRNYRIASPDELAERVLADMRKHIS